MIIITLFVLSLFLLILYIINNDNAVTIQYSVLLPILSLNCLCIEVHLNASIHKVFDL